MFLLNPESSRDPPEPPSKPPPFLSRIGNNIVAGLPSVAGSGIRTLTCNQAVGCGIIEGIDVVDSDAGTKLVEAVKEKLGEGGTLDYVICNAG